jgi:hypothetical protein
MPKEFNDMGELPAHFTQKVRDWEVSLLAQVGGAAAVGGGAWAFSIRSPSLNVKEACFLFAGGLGVGHSLGGASLSPTVYTKLQCVRDFGLADLHRSVGRVGSIGASFSVGYGAMTISAFPLLDPRYLFEESIVHGASAGVGAAALYFVGVWYSGKLGAPGKASLINSYRHSYSR